MSFKRVAMTSDDYIKQLGEIPKTSLSEKREILAKLLAQPDGLQKLGESFVGPTILRLKYEGLVRNFLKEYALGKGEEPLFDVFDYVRGAAYIMNANEGGAQVKRFEGKRVRADLFRIASYPVVPKEDLYDLKIDTLQNALDLSKQEIQMLEDTRFLQLLDAAVTDWQNSSKHTDTPNHTIVVSGSKWIPEAFHTACGIVASHLLEATRILMNAQDYYDILDWGIDQVGFQRKDEVVGGKLPTKYGPLTIYKSVMVPKNVAYVLPEPEYVGIMPIRYSLDVEEANNVPEFHVGYVMDEYIGMVIQNPRGIVKLVKG